MSQTLYKTPFSPAYWRDALADFKKPRTLVFSALMVAACVALSYLKSIPIVDNVRVTWGFLARALCALVGGPVNALAFGFVEDTVSYFMNPDGGYNPFYIFTTMLGVFTYALFLYRAEVTVTRVFWPSCSPISRTYFCSPWAPICGIPARAIGLSRGSGR